MRLFCRTLFLLISIENLALHCPFGHAVNWPHLFIFAISFPQFPQ